MRILLNVQLHQFQDIICKAQARYARNYKTLHQSEDALHFVLKSEVKINDHTYL